MDEVIKVKNENEDSLAQKQGVVGVGVGHKWADGLPVDNKPAIIVFVEKKRTKRGVLQKFSLADMIPDEIDGYPTDVIEVGKLVKQGGFQSRVRPVKPGFSCGQKNVSAGTIGGFFLDKDGDPVILSNNHVLSQENKAAIGDPIYQPGVYDTTKNSNLSFQGWPDPVGSLPYIGTLKRFVPLSTNGNVQDTAIAIIHPKLISGGLIDPLYPTINRMHSGFGAPVVGQQVQKCGRTTGYTTGRILALNAAFTVGYDIGPLKFNDCVVLSAMSKGGDSGSIIMDMDMKAVCHLFAGSNKVTIANPINYAVNEYGLKPWNPVGIPNVDTLDFNDTTWRQIRADGSIQKADNSVTITSPANHFCYLEDTLLDFKSVSVIANTGTDQGATWGPGLVIQWPTGIMKVNLRFNNKFGGYFNTNANIGIGLVKPNTDYTLRIRKTSATYIGEVMDGTKWYTVIELPLSIFPQSPIAVRVGKTDTIGQPTNHTEAGMVGTCTFKDFKQT